MMMNMWLIRCLVVGMIFGWLAAGIGFGARLPSNYNNYLFLGGLALGFGSSFAIFIILIIGVMKRK